MAASLIVAILAGGHVRALEHVRLRWWALAPIGVALQLAPLPSPRGLSLPLSTIALIASFPLLLTFAVRNYRVAGLGLIFAGLTLNFAVIAVNGGMPVSSAAVRSAGGAADRSALISQTDARHHVMAGDDELVLLADVIPIPVLGEVLSAGDVLIYSGLGWFLIASMRAPIPGRVSPARRANRPRGYRGKHRPHRRPPPGSPMRLHPAGAGRSGTAL